MPTDIALSIAAARTQRIGLRAPPFWSVFPLALGLISIGLAITVPAYRNLGNQSIGLENIAGP